MKSCTITVPRWNALRFAGAALLVASLAGCSSGEVEADSSEAAASKSADESGLKVRLAESPSGGARFTFCDTPRPSTMNMTNAAWLSMFAANEYAHFGYFAPQLLALGFGNPNGSDAMWRTCGEDLQKLDVYERTRGTEILAAMAKGPRGLVDALKRESAGFGACGRSFFATGYTGVDAVGRPEQPSTAFKRSLVQKADSDNWIRFFTGRPSTRFEKMVGRGSTQAMVARHGEKPVVIVSFRGTEPGFGMREMTDLVTDMIAMKEPLADYGYSQTAAEPGGKASWGSAHAGFLSGLSSVADDEEGLGVLMASIHILTGGDPSVGIYVTGHSLGGALATLMSARLLDEMDAGAQLSFKGLYTFGSPRVGDEAFSARLTERAAAYGASIVRFRNDNDVVTSLPDKGYAHVGDVAFLTKSGLHFTRGSEHPSYGSFSLDDHDSAGIDPVTRAATSGYYSRIVARLRGKHDAALDACDGP